MISDLPPAPGDLLCCMAAATTGGEHCTCWEPILGVVDPVLVVPVSQEPLQEGPTCARRSACGDCAYRVGSPERSALEGELPGYGTREQFYCHDGMALVVAWQHPSGAVRPAFDPEAPQASADYYPATRPPRAWRLDGSPAVLCAGWAAVNGVPRANPAVQS
jgi:hypothetical protein